MTDKEKLNEIIQKKFMDSDKNNPPVDFTYEDVSKVVFEKYVGKDRGNIKIFFFTRGKSGNNKPYSLDGRTLDEYIQFNEMLEKCRDDVEDLFTVSEDQEEVSPPSNPFGETEPDTNKNPWNN